LIQFCFFRKDSILPIIIYPMFVTFSKHKVVLNVQRGQP
jgi:hypothetical protein